MRDVAGANLSYKREAFDLFGPFIEGTYCSDTEFNWRLERASHRVRFDPAIAICHHGMERLLPFISHELDHGRSFGRVRVRAQQMSVGRRALYVGLWPLIPLVLLGRTSSQVLGSRRYLGPFVCALPLLLAGQVSWSAGECLGYLAPGR